MANLQVKNLPDRLHRRLTRLARTRGTTVREVVLEAVRREVAQEEFAERLRTRKPVDLRVPAARRVDEARAERERALAR